MTLLEVIRLIERIAGAQPSVNMIVENDVYKLNSIKDAKYGVFAFVQTQHSERLEGDFKDFGFSLFYVDRLIEGKRNQLEVQSVGVETLSNILRSLNDNGLYVESATFQVFNQRFTDECAGVFCNVTISTPNGLCAETFENDNNIKIV